MPSTCFSCFTSRTHKHTSGQTLHKNDFAVVIVIPLSINCLSTNIFSLFRLLEFFLHGFMLQLCLRKTHCTYSCWHGFISVPEETTICPSTFFFSSSFLFFLYLASSLKTYMRILQEYLKSLFLQRALKVRLQKEKTTNSHTFENTIESIKRTRRETKYSK